MCVCLSVCKSHLTSEAFVNAATYSAGKEGQSICAIFSETTMLQRLSAPSLGWPYILLAIFPADDMHTHCAYASFLQGLQYDAPCRKLSLCSSFMMIILGLESSSW